MLRHYAWANLFSITCSLEIKFSHINVEWIATIQHDMHDTASQHTSSLHTQSYSYVSKPWSTRIWTLQKWQTISNWLSMDNLLSKSYSEELQITGSFNVNPGIFNTVDSGLDNCCDVPLNIASVLLVSSCISLIRNQCDAFAVQSLRLVELQ